MRFLKVALVVLGITSVISQLVIIREFLAIFGGNELIFGIILGNWTLLTGIGSFLGKYLPGSPRMASMLHIGMGTLPLTILLILRITRNVLFTPGEIVSLSELFIWSFVILLPLCLLTGSYLTLACTLFSEDKKGSDIGSVYVVDSIGDITGGALFSFVLIYLWNQIQVTYLLFLINFFISLVLSLSISSPFRRGSRITYVVIMGLCVFGFIITVFDLNGESIAVLYRGQQIIHEKNSLYGYIVVTENAGQITVFENNVPFFSTGDIIKNEETVHYAMAQIEKENIRVLLLGGGISGTLKEIWKYPVSAVDYVEIDPDILEVGRVYSDLGDTTIHIMDGRQFVKTCRSMYDVIIQDVPDPDSLQLNRLYTVEFFGEVKRILSEGGVFSLSVSASPNYLGQPTRLLNSVIYQSLKPHFTHILVIPGTDTYFLASDAPLTYAILERIDQGSIHTEFINPYYLSGLLTEDRITMVEDSIQEEVKPNTDFHPEAYYHFLVHWMSQFQTSFLGFLAIIALCVVVLFLKISPHPLPFALFTTGFTGASLEVVLVLGFQIIYGYIYSQIGILLTAFLTGLMMGAFYINKEKKVQSFRSLIVIECGIIISSGVLALILPSLIRILFPVFMVVLGILVGAEFSLVSVLYYSDIQTTASALFSADLLGGCIGALLVSTVLIPLIGVLTTCGVVAGLNGVSLLLLVKSRPPTD